MNEYELAWNILLEKLEERTSWGKNQLKKEMSNIIINAQREKINSNKVQETNWNNQDVIR